MNLLRKVGCLVTGTPPLNVAEVMRERYEDVLRRIDLLRAHAEMAPQRASRQNMQPLILTAEMHADYLRGELREAGWPAPAADPQVPSAGALNHWGRLVQDLELHRASVRKLREIGVQLAQARPSLVALFEKLGRDDERQCERLRYLIARADPQALD